MKRIAMALIVLAAAPAWSAAPPKPTPPPKEKGPEAPRWIPAPAPREDGRFLKYHVSALFEDDYIGQRAFTVFDLSAKRRLDEYSVTAEGTVRFTKTSSNQDFLDTIEVRSAKVSLMETWFQLSAGRMDIGEMITPCGYFGAYPLMGIRRVDAASAVVPIRFAFGIEDYKGVSAPPTALSVFYIPSLFSGPYVNHNGSQSFVLGQARGRANLSGVQTTFLFNVGGCKSEYFTYSSINGGSSYSASLEFLMARNYAFYTEYGVQNTRRKDTTAFAYGARVMRIGTWGPFSVDECVVEMQMPVSKSTGNPFTGGNSVVPGSGTEPETTWYGKIRARIKAVFLEAHVTKNVGDYTFARLSPEALNDYFPYSIGPANEADGIRTPFIAKDYDTKAYLFRMGVEF